MNPHIALQLRQQQNIAMRRLLDRLREFKWAGFVLAGLLVGLWIPFLVVAIPTAVLFWLDYRRFPPHCCQSCGYNLTGNTTGVCPECGEQRK